jgi:ABC-type dipeptide/oligopeptide/nickel transport system permease component
MLLVLGRRLFNVIPTLLAVVALVFLLFSVLPGSFISGMGEDGRTTIDPAVMERMRKEMGLDDALPERFAKYIANVATGDLGISFRTREPVTKLIGVRIWPSLKLVFAAMTFAISVGVTLGFLAALRPGSLLDTVSMVTAISGLSLSQFWVGLQFGSLMGQAVVVEKLFAWPGVGSLMVDSVFQRDMPAVQGCILLIVVFFLFINTLVDIAYVVIDPRIRYG